jgi:hypothetical protein
VALGSHELGLLGSLEWEKYDLEVEGGNAQCGMTQEEIETVKKWINLRVDNLKKRRDQ